MLAVYPRFMARLPGRSVETGGASCGGRGGTASPSTRAAVAGDEGAPCPKAVLSLGLPGGGRVRGADVYMTNGIAQIGDEAAFLDQTADGWRISAAGCVPTRADLPYDCELER